MRLVENTEKVQRTLLPEESLYSERPLEPIAPPQTDQCLQNEPEDLIQQLKRNVSQLSDLNDRLSFILKEINEVVCR